MTTRYEQKYNQLYRKVMRGGMTLDEYTELRRLEALLPEAPERTAHERYEDSCRVAGEVALSA